ncbi:hypothetical protein [Altibacter sp. HG106]|uniref:hypothetical protein n=1 Tax=Altibacter sp. HG106 TaxID=3023937 RepID=UPI00234FE0A8|nr:hypothetical protein [Altibacter sp. HG106]MDC7994456.1 hypothetical protein [Altibacter sp. HG106]
MPKSILNPGAGAGAVASNDPNMVFVRSEDILSRPERNANGVLLQGSYTLKEGARMFTIYGTPTSHVKNYTTEGDEDKETIKQKLEIWTPGDSLDLNEFVQNNLGVGYEIIADNCVDERKRVYGTKCSPMKLRAEKSDDSSGRGVKLMFEQAVGSKYVPAHYDGNLVFAEPTDTDVTIEVTKANGNQYRVEELDATAAVDIASIDHDHGAFIDFIGDGGDDPATLSSGAATAATVLLVDGVDWTALKNSVITFKVFKDDGTTYLVEQSRT